MDALLPAFAAAALAEIGDKTQLLAVLLVIRLRNSGAVLGGIAVAALANSVIAAEAGALAAGHIPFRAATLMLAVALVSAGSGALFRQKQPNVGIYERMGPFAASGVAFFILEFGDKTQFVTFAIAAHARAPLLTAAGAAGGVVAASALAVALGENLPKLVPLGRIRIGFGILFLLIGAFVAAGALRLF